MRQRSQQATTTARSGLQATVPLYLDDVTVDDAGFITDYRIAYLPPDTDPREVKQLLANSLNLDEPERCRVYDKDDRDLAGHPGTPAPTATPSPPTRTTTERSTDTRVTDPYGHAYNYNGEEILIETTLSEEQHHGSYEAVGIPAPPYDPDRGEISIEPANGRDAERLRRYLREQRLHHHSELMVTYDPDTPSTHEIDSLLARLAAAPVFPGELEELAHRHAPDAGVRAAVEALHECAGTERTGGYIQAAQRREAETRELISLAEELALAEDALDEAVIDTETDEPSSINSEGHDAQIRHLVVAHGADGARRLIEQAAR